MELSIRELVESSYLDDSRRVYATLARLLGDLDLAEDATHEAFSAALTQWPSQGVPANRYSWLVSTGRFKAIDALRKRSRYTLMAELPELEAEQVLGSPEEIDDEVLRLVFTCCHPSLTKEAQIALTLREVAGLTTEEIAKAFLIPVPTLAQRIVRAKDKIRSAKIPFEFPEADELAARLDTVLNVIYLIFNEGYSASFGTSAIRHDLVEEAIRLAESVQRRFSEPAVSGLLALMVLHKSRVASRLDASGDLVALQDQDRTKWDAQLIQRGCSLVEESLRRRSTDRYTIQAAISAIHAQSPSYEATDWHEIAGFYRLLLHLEPSPVIELNLAVALSLRDGPSAGMEIIERLVAGPLSQYHLAFVAQADLLTRMGAIEPARTAYARAIELCAQGPEKRFLMAKLDVLE